MRILSMTVATLALAATLATAGPGVRVEYPSGVPQILLEGDYRASYYTVHRATSASGPFTMISRGDILCVSSCFVDDETAVPGHTYWYRFDVRPQSSPTVSYGPYPVTIAAPYPGLIHARVTPNPSTGPARIEVYLHGAVAEAPLETRATVLDLQGRRVRVLFQGPLRRGVSSLTWDGRDDRGSLVPGGQYFLRLVSPLGTSIQRLVRTR